MATVKFKKRTNQSPPRKPTSRGYKPPANDNITRAFDLLGLIPASLRGTEEFLDVVTWNLRWFHQKEPERVERVAEILAALNADVMVFQEIAEGSLEPVAQYLEQRGAGYYSVAYGTTGGQQRVGFLWDLEWMRSKDDTRELFSKGEITTGGKDAFPRLPFWGYFTGLQQSGSKPAFDFQLVGVHLKSQMGGGSSQRKAAAGALAKWFTSDAKRVDSDVLVLGDFNKEPDSPDWAPLHQLEREKKAYFQKINDQSDFSHLYYTNKQNIGSRLDLVLMSSSAKLMKTADPKVVKWASLDTFLSQQPSATEIKKYLADIRATVSDHMPVVTRFYFK